MGLQLFNIVSQKSHDWPHSITLNYKIITFNATLIDRATHIKKNLLIITGDKQSRNSHIVPVYCFKQISQNHTVKYITFRTLKNSIKRHKIKFDEKNAKEIILMITERALNRKWVLILKISYYNYGICSFSWGVSIRNLLTFRLIFIFRSHT